jgi:hypothetical protein
VEHEAMVSVLMVFGTDWAIRDKQGPEMLRRVFPGELLRR